MDPSDLLSHSLPSHQSSSSVPSPHTNVSPSVAPSSKPSRHVCPDCGRSYKAAETLNRHRKNHSDTTQYVCRVCSASFKRKDLLDRHSQIHIHGSPSARSSRSQRACIRCSRLKTRCDNLKPCTRCARGGHDCLYAENRSRARTDRSITGSPGRRESSASSAMASDAPLSTGIPISASSIDSIDSWDRDGPWAESLWTQSYPWMSNPSPQQNALPDAMHHAYAVTTGEHGTMNWDPTFHSNAVENVAVPVPMHNAFVDNSAAGNAPWTQWQRYNTAPTDASTSFDGQSLSRSTVSSDLVTEIGSNSIVAEPIRQSTTSYDHLNHAARQRFVTEMALLAVNFVNLFPHTDDRAALWQHISQRAESAFNLQSVADPQTHLLQHYINLYCRYSHTCWPIRYRPDLNSKALPPHLYLIMATVGAAHAGEASRVFHCQMMDALRPQIVLAAIQKQIDDEQVLPLIESLLIIQTCTLYYGDRKAFSFVPQISSIAMSLGRRINLFDDPDVPPEFQSRNSYPQSKPGDPYRWWEKVESHRRLAIAFLRAEVFVSLLSGTRPLISYESIHVRSPIPDTIWLGQGSDGEDALRAAVWDENSYTFSSLVRAILDWSPAVPNIRFDELESVLFGLQSDIWRFSQDPGLARRLAEELDSDNFEDCVASGDTNDLPGEMRDLRNDYARTTHALKKWKGALDASAPDTLLPHERKSLLASNILYNTSLVQLRADLPGLHRIALACVRDEQPSHRLLSEAYRWAGSESASRAIESACSTWSLISNELKRPELVRAEFNILSHIGLLHVAVVVWVYAGVHVDPGSTNLRLDSLRGSENSHGEACPPQLRDELRLCRSNNPWIMQSIATLLNDIQSLHGTGYACYYNTIEALAQRPLPPLGRSDLI